MGFWKRALGGLADYLRPKTQYPEFGLSQRLTGRVRWSVLAAVGTSLPARLSILVPALGTLLLFNQSVVEILTYSTRFLANLGIKEVDADSYTLGNLYFLYFGLCATGVASLLFNVFRPSEIKRHPDRMSYVTAINLDASPAIAKSNLESVLSIYFEHHESNGDNKESALKHYPILLEIDFTNLISEMFQNMDKSHLFESVEDDDNYWTRELYTGAAMYPNIANIAYLAHSNQKMVWIFTEPFRALAVRFSQDVAFVRHLSLDLTAYKTRVRIALLYAIGFALLAIPTVLTFARLLVAPFLS